MRSVELEGPILAIVVHARGAVITRRVHLPEGTNGELECVVAPLYDHLQEGTLSLRLGPGEGRIISVRTRVVRPPTAATGGPLREKSRALEHRIADREAEHSALQQRLNHWNQLQAFPGKLKDLRKNGPQTQVHTALQVLSLAAEERTRQTEAILALREEIAALQREIMALEIQSNQGSDEADRGDDAPHFQAIIHLSDVADLESFDLTYVVDEARWWPTYSVHLDTEGQTMRLELEAVVTQRTGSDWTGVSLALSTAELNTDARLPKLPSLRLGRAAAPPPPSGYRAPPEGLGKLFAAYDQARKDLQESPPLSGGPPPSPPPRASPDSFGSGYDSTYADEGTASFPTVEGIPEYKQMDEAPMRRRSQAPRASSAGAPPASMSSLASPGAAPKMKKKAPPRDAKSQAEMEPAEGWLDFDGLRLGAPESPSRGKLVRKPTASLGGSRAPLPSPAGLIDPIASRGHFDYRYDGEGLFEVPSDGRLHRVRLFETQGHVGWVWRTVPRVEAAVYREVILRNPLDTALLDGQARIFVDGEFTSISRLHRVDRGGSVRLGLGVEDRIQVRRNARFDEEGQGFLKGRRALDHSVEITLRSSLSHPVDITVVDRIPVTDDENVQVELVKDVPVSREYDQSDVGAPLRGGRTWTLHLAPEEQIRVEYTYRVQIRSRDELIGGNRRES